MQYYQTRCVWVDENVTIRIAESEFWLHKDDFVKRNIGADGALIGVAGASQEASSNTRNKNVF
jgi:hypothetical protein